MCLLTHRLTSNRLQSLSEASGVILLGKYQSLEPIGEFGKSLFACYPGHLRVKTVEHMGLACDGSFEILDSVAHGHSGSRVAKLLQELQIALCVARFALRGVPE